MRRMFMSDNFFAQLNNGKWYKIKSVDKICADLKNSFQYLQEQNEQYAQQLLSFNKDAEIENESTDCLFNTIVAEDYRQ